MVALSHQVIPVSPETLEKFRESLKISAGAALLLNEYEETKAALERRGFTGIKTISDLKTGDHRYNHIIWIHENEESITKNEMIVYIECGKDPIAHKSFNKLTTTTEEVENWLNGILEEHINTHPIQLPPDSLNDYSIP